MTPKSNPPQISAIILAAGRSRRMGKPKMVLPWGNTTVLGRVIQVLQSARLEDILVITGGARQQVEAELNKYSVRAIHNPRYRQDQMAISLKVGLQNLPGDRTGALVALGDQPQIEVETVERLLSAACDSTAPFLIPSYQMRRGHPWIIQRELWPEVLAIKPHHTLRDFLNANSEKIQYVPIQTDSIFQDLDTPQDYREQRPK